MAASGHSLAFEAARGGRLEELAVLWKGDPASFLTADACGCLPSWAWWDVSNPTASGNLIAWFKHHGVWHESVAFTVEGRRNFLMHGLQKASKKKAASDGEVDLLDWQLARLETELPASMWVSPDASGETLPFWLSAMGRHDMVERYVQPRKEAFLQASLAHVEATQPAKPRPRF